MPGVEALLNPVLWRDSSNQLGNNDDGLGRVGVKEVVSGSWSMYIF